MIVLLTAYSCQQYFYFLEVICMKMNQSTLNQAIYETISLPDHASIIDLGCRNAGYLNGIIETFPDKVVKAIGVDVTDKNFGGISYCPPVELKVMNCAEQIAFEDNTFDLVFAKDMLECITDKTGLVKEINRILKPGGMVICVNADFDSTIYNGENKDLITKALHAYAITKQGWMDDIDSWMGRRTYSVFHQSGFFESSVFVHSVIETEYTEGSFGYEYSRHIGWLVEKDTGALTKEEYDEFICNLIDADKAGSYLYSKPYYIYKGIKMKQDSGGTNI